MKTPSSLPGLLALACLLGLPLSSRAANVVVTILADSGPGSLRAAVAFAGTNAGGAVITFDPALDGQVIFTTSEIMLTNQVTIDASELTHGITISGTDAFSSDPPLASRHRIFQVASSAVVELDNLTIQGGYGLTMQAFQTGPGGPPGHCGGGILVNAPGVTLTLNNCALSGNYAASSGGAIAALTTVTLTLNNCAISNNIANYGGGIYCRSPVVVVNDSIFSGNAATTDGGAIYGPGTLNRSTLCNNYALRTGGGIRMAGPIFVDNCTLSGNSAPSGGGILRDTIPGIVMNNSTLSGNVARFSGGGIQFNSAASVSRLTNSIVAGNTAGANANLNLLDLVESSNSLTNGNPLLAPLGNYGGPTPTMPPLAGSPALDAGTDSVTSFLATDQRGYPRLSGAHVDIGAVEIQVVTAANAPVVTNPVVQANGAFAFRFTSSPDAAFTVLASTNVVSPLSQWNILGPALHNPPGQYQFTDPNAANHPRRFYQVTSP